MVFSLKFWNCSLMSWAAWPGFPALTIAFRAQTGGSNCVNPLSWSAGARRAPIVWVTPLDQSRGCALTPGPRYRHAPPVLRHPVTSPCSLYKRKMNFSYCRAAAKSAIAAAHIYTFARCVGAARRHRFAHSAVNEHVRENYCGRIP